MMERKQDKAFTLTGPDIEGNKWVEIIAQQSNQLGLERKQLRGLKITGKWQENRIEVCLKYCDLPQFNVR